MEKQDSSLTSAKIAQDFEPKDDDIKASILNTQNEIDFNQTSNNSSHNEIKH